MHFQQLLETQNTWKIGVSLHHETPVCCCSVAKLCLTFCDPMNCSMPGLPVSPTPGVYSNSCSSSWWFYPAISSSVTLFSSIPQTFPAPGSFPVSQLFVSGGQSIRASASASVLPMNIQGWFPLGWTGLISLLSMGLSRIFSSITVRKCRFFGIQCSYSPSLTSIQNYCENHSFDYPDYTGLCW